ncbi:NAD-dependent protein deacylase [Methanococcoides alaskense]|uniref:NAD-dependent deacetylase n=1 Tax=Methanococcoides alaskense TaxID=325778 RepID=A0AA90TZU7_9EURY|nr:NAD-dependent protein deacylase [Methanococcoides alaskense]MDA0524501.1 NAD-dependent protein deacylase [Methanococcoides alaskense]MDR6223323.1 NAD-dependent deacetylase [Methanococcoides alaskense]
MKELFSLLENSSYCVVLTGAGVSTFSGIPDFRGSSGIYNEFDADLIFSIEHFKKEPSYFYGHSKDLIYNLEHRQPSIVHRVLSELEEREIIKTIITQNIDMLHQKAGSKNVIEVHGSPQEYSCLVCGKKYTYEYIAVLLRTEDVPTCNECGGLIKPDIIFYGEMLKQDVIEKAIEESSKADILLVLGSTLVVQPATSLPLYTIENGGNLVIVNNMETPLDGYAIELYKDLGDVFISIAEHFDIDL